jgi:3'-phosphoadenosine 5'-phosphosulfate sulfotransferase
MGEFILIWRTTCLKGNKNNRISAVYDGQTSGRAVERVTIMWQTDEVKSRRVNTEEVVRTRRDIFRERSGYWQTISSI